MELSHDHRLLARSCGGQNDDHDGVGHAYIERACTPLVLRAYGGTGCQLGCGCAFAFVTRNACKNSPPSDGKSSYGRPKRGASSRNFTSLEWSGKRASV